MIKTKRFFTSLLAVFCILGCLQPFAMKAQAKDAPISVKGNMYEFESDAHYEFSSATPSSGDAFGTFTISGALKSTSNKNGLPAYSVSSGSVDFYYSYNRSKLNTTETEWHLIDDKTKKVDTLSLDQNILSGAIIIQSSNDGENWITDVTMTNAFTADTDLSGSLYSTKDIQLENGCYYRVIVAYELQRKVGEGKILFVSIDDKEERKVAEVYEFYAVSSEIAGNTTSADIAPKKVLGQKAVNTGKDTGYSGSDVLDKDDPHYHWNLGTFVVNGYTGDTTKKGPNGEEIPVFLKNVGDKVTLWFTLAQDINKLNGNSALTISEDTNGYDQYFEIPQTNFKHGTLIIRYTDYENKVHDPVVYTDFLSASATTGADTRVQLFEEGDYEVSLDYEIKNNPRQIGPVSVAPKYTNYKIFFKFSIRNGNCMVYPFDVVTGSELPDNAITATGFRLDLANSRYLDIEMMRTALNVGSNGLLVADQRVNQITKEEGISYTDEGIYTFTVSNPSTGATTTKIIYVGTNKYLLALSKNVLTVNDLNEKIAQGATIEDDGTIVDYIPEPEPEAEPEPSIPEGPESQPAAAVDMIPDDPPVEEPVADSTIPDVNEASQNNPLVLPLIVLSVVVAIVIACMIAKKIKKRDV